MKKSDLPDKKKTSNGSLAASQNLTLPNLVAVLKSMGITLRFNLMTNAAVFEADGVGTDALSQDTVRLTVQDALLGLDINNLGRFDEMVQALARAQSYHPMAEWLRSLAQDDVDHIGELAESITTDCPLWEVYLRKWMIQTVEAVCGYDRERKMSIPHVLTLVGGQGVGKSHWLESLGAGWMKGEAELHLASASGKDHQIEALRFPMVELAELDGIFRKSDISHMKSFISREEDAIRAPYERRALVRPRMTSFCGSVNAAEFLTDATGSRRFWPVQVEAIDWDVQASIEGAWAQAYEAWAAGEGFMLTAEQEAVRAAQSLDEHTTLSPEAEEITTYYSAHQHLTDTYQPMNRTEILRMLGYRNLAPRQVAEAGRVLVSLLGKHRTLPAGNTTKKRAWMFPFNEFAQDRATWPRESHLRLVEPETPESE